MLDLESLSQMKLGKAKINYFAHKFQQFKGDCKSTWKKINSIIRPNRINKKNIINKICENVITYVTKNDISNVLNSYVSVYLSQ